MKISRLAVVLFLLLPACSDDPADPPDVDRAGRYTWGLIDTLGSGGRVVAVAAVAPGEAFAITAPLDRRSDGWRVFPALSLNRYDGIAWAPIAEFVATTYPSTAWGSSASNLYLADGTLRRFNGSSWTDLGVPVNLLYGISATDIYAASSWNQRQVYHFDGVEWTLLRDFGVNNNEPILGMWASSASFLVVSRHEGISVWDGETWTETEFNSDRLYGAWGTAANDAYVVGGKYGEDALVLHFNGSAWERTDLADVPRLVDIWGSGPTDIYAVGEEGAIVHFNGATWTLNEQVTCKRLGDITGTGPSDIFVAGDDGKILHFDGVEWESIGKNAPDEHGTFIFAESPTRFAVTNYLDCGTVYFFRDGEWTESAIGYRGDVYNMAGRSLDDLWLDLGERTAHYDGSTWTLYDAFFNYGATDLWVPETLAPFAANDKYVYRFNGTNPWSHDLDLSPYRAVGLWGSGDIVYAASEQFVYRREGFQWTNFAAPDDRIIDISGVTGDEMYSLTVGPDGMSAWRYNGATWVKLPGGHYGDHIMAGAPNNVFTYEPHNCLFGHFDGAVWKRTCDRKSTVLSMVRASDGTILRLTQRAVETQKMGFVDEP